jgi:hypothetical protein
MKYSKDDMDDLFKRASEGYPLKTDSGDWDRLAGALDRDPAPPSDGEEKRRRRGAFWWFLLIPLAGIGYLTWQARVHHSSDQGMTVVSSTGKPVRNSATTGAAANPSTSGDQPTTRDRASSGDKPTTRDRSSSDNQTTSGNPAASGDQPTNGATGNRSVSRINGDQSTSGANGGVPGGSITGGGIVRHLRISNGIQPSGRDNAAARGGAGGAVQTNGTNGAVQTSGTAGRDATGPNNLVAAADHDPALAMLDLRRAPIAGGYNVVVNVVAPVMPANRPNPGDSNHHKRTSHGYIGISAAPDFSTVRFQPMKGVGTTFGVLLGYSFNDRWAVESGLYVDRKRYYTDGEYFNTKSVHLQPYSKLLNVDGTCYMWEIPVNVRYNISKGPKMKWFATAGLSTYLMSKENYTYEYEINMNTEESTWNIHKPSQYWFTIANVSVGFEQRIGKIGNLRLEPYVRVPLSGIGTGSLPIVSAGLNIGLTRQLW